MESKKRVLLSFIIFVFVLIVGVAGFKFFGGKGWTLLDSLYMTVITLSTVGYEEALDISANPAARIFTVVFILTCLGTIAFAISSITAFVIEGELKQILWRKKMEKEISKLKGHYIVCGSDETAKTIIQELLSTKKSFIVIEQAKDKIENLLSLFDNFLYIQGDPAEDDVLSQAKIGEAKGILLSLPTDEENLFVTLSARNLNPGIRIVTKGIDVKSHAKMRKAGADSVVSPTHIGGMRMVSEMIRPAVVTFLDMMLRDREKNLRFEEILVSETSSLAGLSIRQFKSRDKSGALLVAVKNTATGEYEFNPPEDTAIQKGDALIFIATPEMMTDFK